MGHYALLNISASFGTFTIQAVLAHPHVWLLLLLFQAVDDDQGLSDIHENAEKFSPIVEQVFKYLQIISASAMSFAHGANDVANAVGPFAAIYGIYQYGFISSKSTVEIWMLAGIGATGKVGLGTRALVLIFGQTTRQPSRSCSTQVMTPAASYCVEAEGLRMKARVRGKITTDGFMAFRRWDPL